MGDQSLKGVGIVNLRLLREPTIDGATLGVLFRDGVFECFTVEDAIREVSGQPVESWKVPGETAIPFGRYQVVITQSQRFGRRLPLLLNVPGFDGIRIHPGNTAQDSEGCILPGRVRGVASVLESRMAFTNLYEALRRETGETWLSIESAA